ncbi:hypothetical protein [Borreliella lusitaniae]|uniref:hypothetical protein n=1 Tax=Borreliella lusitaniae TaxID=100177 RepID=UPI003AB12E16
MVKKTVKRVVIADKKQITFENHIFFKKEVVGDKIIYHTRLMNIFRVFDAKRNKFLINVVNFFTKENRWVTLFPVKDNDAFLGGYFTGSKRLS